MVHEVNDVGVFLSLRENIESKISTRFKDIHCALKCRVIHLPSLYLNVRCKVSQMQVNWIVCTISSREKQLQELKCDGKRSGLIRDGLFWPWNPLKQWEQWSFTHRWSTKSQLQERGDEFRGHGSKDLGKKVLRKEKTKLPFVWSF